MANDVYVYSILGVVLIVGLFFILGGNQLIKKKTTKGKKQLTTVEQMSELNSVIYLLHKMAKTYKAEDFSSESVESFVDKIIVGKTWEDRLKNIPSDEQE